MNNKTRKPWFKRWQTWLIILVTLIILGIILPEPSEKQSETNTAVKDTKQNKSEEIIRTVELTDEDREIAKEAVAVFEEQKKKNATNIVETDSEQVTDESVQLSVEVDAVSKNKALLTDIAKKIYGKDNFVKLEYVYGVNVAAVNIRREGSPNSVKTLFLDDTTKLLKNVIKVKGLEGVQVIVMSPLKDTYGNVAEEKVLSINISRNTMDKINFDNFNYKDIPNIADDYWEHPLFSKK